MDAKPRCFLGLLICSIVTVGCNAPSDNEPKLLLDLKKKCEEAGQRARAAELEMYSTCRDSSDPRYAYNNVLKTCLYADRCYAGNSYKFIMDAFSRSMLIRYDVRDGYYSGTLPGLPAKPSSGKDVFDATFRELFGPNTEPPD